MIDNKNSPTVQNILLQNATVRKYGIKYFLFVVYYLEKIEQYT